jgi:hypothetical protein
VVAGGAVVDVVVGALVAVVAGSVAAVVVGALLASEGLLVVVALLFDADGLLPHEATRITVATSNAGTAK